MFRSELKPVFLRWLAQDDDNCNNNDDDDDDDDDDDVMGSSLVLPRLESRLRF